MANLEAATVTQVTTPHNIVTTDKGRVRHRRGVIRVTGGTGDDYTTGGVLLLATPTLEASAGFNKVVAIVSVACDSADIRAVPALDANGDQLHIHCYDNDDDAETDNDTSLDGVTFIAEVEGY